MDFSMSAKRLENSTCEQTLQNLNDNSTFECQRNGRQNILQPSYKNTSFERLHIKTLAGMQSSSSSEASEMQDSLQIRCFRKPLQSNKSL